MCEYLPKSATVLLGGIDVEEDCVSNRHRHVTDFIEIQCLQILMLMNTVMPANFHF